MATSNQELIAAEDDGAAGNDTVLEQLPPSLPPLTGSEFTSPVAEKTGDDQMPIPPPTCAEGSDDGSHGDVYRPSNTHLLCIAFTSFLTFAIVELVFAFVAKSKSMIGDSVAMIVDSLTYLFNWYAERRKTRFDQEYENETLHPADPVRDDAVRLRERRKLVLRLEIISPLISVVTLAAVTIVILKQAIEVLILDITRRKDEQGNPDIHLMLGFSVANLALDFVNVFCFARAKHLLGYETRHHSTNTLETTSTDCGKKPEFFCRHKQQESHDGKEVVCDCADLEDGEGLGAGIDQEPSPGNVDKRANVNMCSAYTHVFADTLRSLAVIIAALVAEFTGVTSEEADSAGAIAVSILILMSLTPLVRVIYQSTSELMVIRAQEKQERAAVAAQQTGTDSI
ncbi:hypothetical protein ACA910_007799 [Epithemia clementina (nom. ined.)]